ncbi:MAG: phosphoribosyl-AMP cyclohydrolase [Deltaproteobacteria bacterium RBG_13_52_11]|nr:MAG: phosphoribosyl-AMP cyclohydrolase [Deltaproteobacteria bacterium RBG_13_52_11]
MGGIEPNFDRLGGLIPVVVQDYTSGEILMLAFMNRQAWGETLRTRLATYWSRSRNELWVKGEQSGNLQEVKEIYVDCNEDTVLLKVTQQGGGACHTGHRSCFYRRLEGGELKEIDERVFDPEEVYR